MAEELNRNINLIGFQEIDSFEKSQVLEHATIFYDKFNLKTKNVNAMEIHLKEYKKNPLPNGREKFSIHLRVHIAGMQITAKHHGWNLSQTMLKALKEVQKELDRKFKKFDKTPKKARTRE
ncbi:MAG: hypothetical protein Q7S21_02600 [archaeon]|nr:hypothetical protein [archaeon]